MFKQIRRKGKKHTHKRNRNNNRFQIEIYTKKTETGNQAGPRDGNYISYMYVCMCVYIYIYICTSL